MYFPCRHNKKSLHPKIQRLSLSNTYKIPYLYAQATLCAQMTLIHNVKKGDTLISLKLSFIALPPQPAQPRHPCGTRKLLLSAAPFLTRFVGIRRARPKYQRHLWRPPFALYEIMTRLSMKFLLELLLLFSQI